MPDLVKLISTAAGAGAGGDAGDRRRQAGGHRDPVVLLFTRARLQAGLRMCLVEVEKMPKLMTACTLPVSEGMVVRTETAQVAAARKYMLDSCSPTTAGLPVCERAASANCRNGIPLRRRESRFTEEKVHTPRSSFAWCTNDAPRCIRASAACASATRGWGSRARCDQPRGAVGIAPNKGDHLECDECGACIDICPVGALTSGAYRYKTRRGR